MDHEESETDGTEQKRSDPQFNPNVYGKGGEISVTTRTHFGIADQHVPAVSC